MFFENIVQNKITQRNTLPRLQLPYFLREGGGNYLLTPSKKEKLGAQLETGLHLFTNTDLEFLFNLNIY